MNFRKAELDPMDCGAVLQTLRNAETMALGTSPLEANIPVTIDLGDDSGETRCVVRLGGDDEPIFVGVELAPSQPPATVTVIGKLAAEDLAVDYLTDIDANVENTELFDEWIGEWGGFLRAVVTICSERRDFELTGEAEFAIMETKEEFDQYGHGSGRDVFDQLRTDF